MSDHITLTLPIKREHIEALPEAERNLVLDGILRVFNDMPRKPVEFPALTGKDLRRNGQALAGASTVYASLYPNSNKN